MRKKLLSFMLTLVLLIGYLPTSTAAAGKINVWDGTAVEPSKIVEKDGKNYYAISTPEELAFVAQEEGDWGKKHYLLTDDIYLNKEALTVDGDLKPLFDQSKTNEWKPIPVLSGTIDGNHHTIYGLFSESGGLVNQLDSKGTITNLSIKNAYIRAEYYASGFAGRILPHTFCAISNCSFQGTVLGRYEVGGIAGDAIASASLNNSYIKNCSAEGIIHGGQRVGGILGCSSMYLGLDYAPFVIENCTNKAEVIGSEYVGGILGVGTLLGDGSTLAICKKDQNDGLVSGKNYVGGISATGSTEQCKNTGSVFGESYVGGISGVVNNMSNCYNLAKVSGETLVGGIAGNTNSSQISCCYSTGAVVPATAESKQVFALIGGDGILWDDTEEYNDCYYRTDSSVNSGMSGTGAKSAATGVHGKDLKTLKEKGTYKNWNFTSIWNIDAAYNDGLPYLKWERNEEAPSDQKPSDTKPALKNPFTDVKNGDYFFDPVLWALNHDPQITDGMTETTFAPGETCTRGQVVTFLWRAMGCAEPKSTNNPFSDVKDSDYFYKAVLWAVEKGITDGTSATTFSPNDPCTRAHVVTFLWRAENKPDGGSKNPFKDVASGQYYTDAVLWAVSKGITDGTSDTTFSPNADCTRGQIVTFLYRDMK